MGLFSRAASKGEARTMQHVEVALAEQATLMFGPINLPCHIVREAHAGIWVGSRDKDAQRWLGVYRCQLHFWGIELTQGNINGAMRREDQMGFLQIRALNKALPYTDLGPMANGAAALAYSLSVFDYK